ncbi:MAG: 4Fe-4S dicluster domain-containing protein [Bacillota bacterium]
MPKLVVMEDKCKGCRFCEMACALEHEQVFNPKKARIRTKRYDLPERTSLIYCRHCEEPACVKVCAMGALYLDNSGVVVVNNEDCTGCGLCIEACQYNSISLHPNTGLAIKCDLCAGKPECVLACPMGVLHYEG